jgi:hypothetical protein
LEREPAKCLIQDIYDEHYHHIVLWVEETIRIIGSYRLGLQVEIIAETRNYGDCIIRLNLLFIGF